MPVIQAINNEKFYGAPIERTDLPFGAETPAAYKNMPSTGKFYKDLAQFTNGMLGGDEVTPGSLRNFMNKAGVTDSNKLEHPSDDDIEWVLSGSMMEHFVQGYFSGPVKFLGSMFKAVSGAEMTAKDIPVLRRFYASETADWITTKRFYDLRKRTLQVNEYVKNLKRNHNPEASRAGMLANKKVLQAKPFVDAADTARKALQRMENKIRSSRISQDEKEKQIEVLRKKKIKVTRTAIAKAIKLGMYV